MKRLKRLSLFLCFLLLLNTTAGCMTGRQKTEAFEYEAVRLIVDDEVISSGDNFRVIEPLWWSVSIYDGAEQYNEDLSQFSEPQRYVFAIEWYMAEVNNGGHDQFYFNSTGIVWEDAMTGFQLIGAQENYEIIKESADMLGGSPSKDRDERISELEKYEPDFSELDNRYYESEASMMEKLNEYIKENASDFYFDGTVTIPE